MQEARSVARGHGRMGKRGKTADNGNVSSVHSEDGVGLGADPCLKSCVCADENSQ